MLALIIAGAAAGAAGLVLGGLIGAGIADKRLRRRLSEVGEEIVRMRAVAEAKLASDDPQLPALLKNLQEAAQNAHRALDAMERQSEITREKSAAGREVLSSSRHILAMFAELGADVPELPPPARTPAVEAPAQPAVR